jgi:hypothetical protein
LIKAEVGDRYIEGSGRNGNVESNIKLVYSSAGYDREKRFTTEISDYELWEIVQNKKSHSLSINGFLEALDHFTSCASDKGGMIQIWRLSI